MKIEKQIKFNNDLIPAILEGIKTQTRRAITEWDCITQSRFNPSVWHVQGEFKENITGKNKFGSLFSINKGDFFSAQIQHDNLIKKSRYGKTDELIQLLNQDGIEFGQAKITRIEVKRLDDMKNHDYIAEGYPKERAKYGGELDPFLWFRQYWNSIYKNWDDNPYVWVIYFELINVE